MVGEFQGEEGGMFVNEFQEDLVAFPKGKFKELFLVDPFEVAFVAFDFVAGPFGADEEMHVFCFPDIGDEGDDAAVAPLGDGIACFFEHFAQHAVLGALPFFELTADTEPFVVVQVVFLFGAVEHEVLVAAFQVAEGGGFQDLKI